MVMLQLRTVKPSADKIKPTGENFNVLRIVSIPNATILKLTSVSV